MERFGFRDKYRLRVEAIFCVAAFFVLLPVFRIIYSILAFAGPGITLLLVVAILIAFAVHRSREVINF